MRSAHPMETRVKAWQRLCEAWDVKPWPSPSTPSRRSAHHYARVGTPRSKGTSTAIFWYHKKEFGIEVEPVLRRAAKRLAKAATRGLIAGRLKESFDVDALANRFDIKNASHVMDVLIVACWFMMKEIEMASAKTSDVEFQDNTVSLLPGSTLCPKAELLHAESPVQTQVLPAHLATGAIQGMDRTQHQRMACWTYNTSPAPTPCRWPGLSGRHRLWPHPAKDAKDAHAWKAPCGWMYGST